MTAQCKIFVKHWLFFQTALCTGRLPSGTWRKWINKLTLMCCCFLSSGDSPRAQGRVGRQIQQQQYVVWQKEGGGFKQLSHDCFIWGN